MIRTVILSKGCLNWMCVPLLYMCQMSPLSSPSHLHVCILPVPQSVEAVLFLLQGVASNITQHSSPLLHSILSQFPHMPPHPTLIRTALNLLGQSLLLFFPHCHLGQFLSLLPHIIPSSHCHQSPSHSPGLPTPVLDCKFHGHFPAQCLNGESSSQKA